MIFLNLSEILGSTAQVVRDFLTMKKAELTEDFHPTAFFRFIRTHKRQ
jgi:hypothetical protein